MLKVSDLINIKYIPSISDISLQLLVDFYEQYLSQRIFIFELEDGKTIDIRMNVTDNRFANISKM